MREQRKEKKKKIWTKKTVQNLDSKINPQKIKGLELIHLIKVLDHFLILWIPWNGCSLFLY